jgi:tRNA synthetases class II (D, K and N)
VTENSNTSRHLSEFWMIEPEIAFADLTDNTTLAEGLLKYTFAALLKEREEDLTFFDQRIEKGLVAKLEGIVGSEFVHMDYGEAIRALERANEKFEFPVNVRDAIPFPRTPETRGIETPVSRPGQAGSCSRVVTNVTAGDVVKPIAAILAVRDLRYRRPRNCHNRIVRSRR